MILAAGLVILAAVFVGAAVGLAAALSTIGEGFERRLEDISWVASQVKARAKTDA